jgi:hypothetical protein
MIVFSSIPPKHKVKETLKLFKHINPLNVTRFSFMKIQRIDEKLE